MIKKIVIFIIIFLFFPVLLIKADSIAENTAGRILIAVQSHGEAWYVNPDTLARFYLGRPADAFALMRGQGIGITDNDLKKIPVGVLAANQTDSDQDGLADSLETALRLNPNSVDSDSDGFSDKIEIEKNFNPTGQGVMPVNLKFADKQKGRIFLQVQSRGEAWYIFPENNRRYFLGRPDDAFAAMQLLGLGIKNEELDEINSLSPNYNLDEMEKSIFDLVNRERTNAGLNILKINIDIAAVAREHSRNLSRENLSLTGFAKTCDFPIIHHEGFDFGDYAQDRMNNRNIYYFGMSGENIALMPGVNVKSVYTENSLVEKNITTCRSRRQTVDNIYNQKLESLTEDADKIELVKNEIILRQAAFNKETEATISEIKWDSEIELARKTVAGWMESPGHKANILTPDFDESGVGLAYVNGYIVATQDFIKRAECGFKNGACCEKEGYYPYCYKPLACRNNLCQ